MQEKLAQLKRNYLAQLGERIAILAPLLAHCEQNLPWAEERKALQSQAHALAGTGATFGFPHISEHARTLEEALIDNQQSPSGHFAPMVKQLLDACIAAREESALPAPALIEAQHAPQNVGLPLLLVVDDDPAMHETISELLKNNAHIFTAADAGSGLELMRRYHPALVLLDDQMPGERSGLALLEYIQSLPDISDIPIVMITASARPEDVMRGLIAGAADYITKPFKPAELTTKVRERLGRQHSAILIVDDDEAVCELLEHKFQMAGFKAVCAHDGAKAWKLLQEQSFALAVLDRMMPGYDGMTLLRMMRQKASLASVPVIFLTARHYGADVLDGLNTGAADYITKPFNPDEVVARCLRLLTKQSGA